MGGGRGGRKEGRGGDGRGNGRRDGTGERRGWEEGGRGEGEGKAREVERKAREVERKAREVEGKPREVEGKAREVEGKAREVGRVRKEGRRNEGRMWRKRGEHTSEIPTNPENLSDAGSFCSNRNPDTGPTWRNPTRVAVVVVVWIHACCEFSHQSWGIQFMTAAHSCSGSVQKFSGWLSKNCDKHVQTFNPKPPPKSAPCADSCYNFWTINLKTSVMQ